MAATSKEKIKEQLIKNIKFYTEYPIDDKILDGISEWIASGGNTITQASLSDILINALEKVHYNILK